MEHKTEFSIELSSFIALLFTFIILYKCIKHNKRTSHPLPPGPTGYPLIGCLPEMLKNKPAFRWIHKLMQELDTEIACIRLGNIHVIPIASPELAREFLKKQDAIFASRPDSTSAKLTSNGYLSAVLSPKGDQWKKMRRIMVSEVLSTDMFRWQYERRCEEADHLVTYVYNQCKSPLKNGLVNVRDAAQHYCGNVVRKMVFSKRYFGPGMEDGGPGVEEREHLDALLTILMYLYAFAIGDYLPWLQVFDLDGQEKVIRNAIASLRKYQDREIMERVEMWKHGVRNTKVDLLDVLICLKDSNDEPLLSIQEIKAQVNEIFLAAVDNPSNAVEWAMAEMINQPTILDMAHQDLDRVVGRDRLVQEFDLSKLNYVKAKEGFRLHPLAPFNVPHASIKDTVVGGYFIPKGNHVLLSRPGLGRNPRVWEDPLTFKPERHITDETSEVTLVDTQLHMLSFSTGRRGCPAALLGSTMATMLLARLLQGFCWSAPPNERMIGLVESDGDLFLANPLIAHAIPRLETRVYEKLDTVE